MYRDRSISKGIDWMVIFIYAFLVCSGLLCIFMVEYKIGSNWVSSFLTGQTDYSKQLYFTGICVVAAMFIMLSDSKLYTAFANILYLFGIGLMLLTFVIGKTVNGSKSWIPLGGGFNLQPAELCIIFSSLALAKYLSSLQELLCFPRRFLCCKTRRGLQLFIPAFLLSCFGKACRGGY